MRFKCLSSVQFRLQHDVLVAAFLSAFDSFNGLAVPGSTTVITELYENPPANFKVQMYFRNDTETMQLQPVQVPGMLAVVGSPAIFLVSKLR